MPTAVLKIDGDTSGLSRAFGDMRAQAKATENAIRQAFSGATAAAGQAAQRAEGVYRRSARGMRNEMERFAAAQEREANRTVAAFIRAEDQKRRAATQTAKVRERAEAEASRIARDEAQKRGLSAEAESRVRQRALERLTRSHENEERRRTATTRQQQRERDRLGGGIVRGVAAVGQATFAVARDAHGYVQDARRRRAESEHTLNAAFYQAGIGGAEAQGYRATLQNEVANGSLRGLSLDTVASGLMQAQTQFNVLAGNSPDERRAAMQQQVRLMGFARDTFQDPSEVLRVAGMLQQQGVRGNDQTSVLHAMTGMAQAGAIELGNVTREALGPMMQNIARSVTAGMTPAQRSQAVRNAALETMAVGEVTARAGGRSRDMLNALSKTRASITSERTQENLYARLQSSGGEQGRALAAQMFDVRDGHARLKEGTSAVGFMSQLVAGFGGDVNRVTNLVGAGGAGAPMVLDAQQRRLLLLLASQGEGGQTIAQSVATMQQRGASFGTADVTRGAAIVEGEQRTELQSAEEKRDNALTDNTNALVNLSNSFAAWQTAHPVENSALGQGVELLNGLLGATLAPRAAAAFGGVRAAIAGSRIAGFLGSVGMLGQAALVTASAGVGLGAGSAINQAVYSDRDRQNGLQTNAFTRAFWGDFMTALRQTVRDGMSSATVTVSPVDANIAASQRPAPTAR